MVAFKYIWGGDTLHVSIPQYTRMIVGHKSSGGKTLAISYGSNEHSIECRSREQAVAAFTALVNRKEGDGILDLTVYQTGD